MDGEGPSRQVICGDANAWIAEQTALPGCLITSLPDSSEVPHLGFDGWKRWFADTAQALVAKTPADGVAIFYQTDIKRAGEWVDKGFLVQLGAERGGGRLLWHKAVCRKPAGTVTFGRPAWAHLLCFSRGLRADPSRSTADVLPSMGEMTWARAMGVEACRVACREVLTATTHRTVVDPFCGVGTVLAVANDLGLGAIGVELSRRRAGRARRLSIADGTGPRAPRGGSDIG